jgi:chromosomal replication initiation ATPase DnaA
VSRTTGKPGRARDTGARQLPLDLTLEPRFGREDFLVSPSNEQAWRVIERWPDWPSRILVVVGPEGSGKSHLGAIWAAASKAAVAKAAGLKLEEVPTLVARACILLEDAGAGNVCEQELFHLINSLRETEGYLLVTAKTPPAAWQLALPDLMSRLRLAPVVEISAPDDELVRAVLVKLFHDRQLTVDATVIEYLAMRMERSLGEARRLVEYLDREALSRGRAITRPIAAEVLRRLQPDLFGAGEDDEMPDNR